VLELLEEVLRYYLNNVLYTSLDRRQARDGCPLFTGKSVSVTEGSEQIGKFSQHDLQF